MSSGSFKNVTYKLFVYKLYIFNIYIYIYIYIYKQDLALNDLQWLICYKTLPTPKPAANLVFIKNNTVLESLGVNRQAERQNIWLNPLRL